MALMLNGNHPVSQVKAGTLAREAPDWELTWAQGNVVEHNTYQLNKSCPSHASQGSLSIVYIFGQPGLGPVVMPGLRPVTPL